MSADPVAELRKLADRSRTMADRGADAPVAGLIDKLEEEAAEVARAWSGSSFGYHARVYYEHLQPPPPGAHFSPEWGFIGQLQGSTGAWREYDHEDVVAVIRERAGNPDLAAIELLAADARSTWKSVKGEVLSIQTTYLSRRSDALLEGLKQEAEKVQDFTASEVGKALLPKGQLWSRDSTAISQGLTLAPHQEIVAEVVELRSPFTACRDIADVADRTAAHVERLEAERLQAPGVVAGDRVFIGHGRSLLWRELKDFVEGRLKLSWDEFNRVPVAGITNIARLSEMMNHAGIALLVLTAEDETADGKEVARQNVVHEAGLFQGRLGFARAIVLLEEGCEEFSNIHGLGQIRFPRGRISAAFEEVRRVLEREGFIEAP